MNIARILYPVEVLGPGKRIGIWVCGCNRKCKGCSNPELWKRKEDLEISITDVFELVSKIAVNHEIDGFTISGGEPMDQARELSLLLPLLESISDDILVYTGYTIEELKIQNNEAINSVLNGIAVLIDGEYIQDYNDNSLLRGSSNQIIHVLNPALKNRYEEYLNSSHNQIQNFSTSDGIVSVGIHRRGFS